MGTAFPRLRPAPWDAAVILTILILAAALSLILVRVSAAQERLTAVVYMDGEEMDRVPVDGPEIRRIYTCHGITLEAVFGDGGAQVLRSQCPTQVCVHTGRIVRSGQAIVCLPAGLAIHLEGGSDPAPDAVLR